MNFDKYNMKAAQEIRQESHECMNVPAPKCKSARWTGNMMFFLIALQL